jgi:UDP-2,3-diacylglucosamine pyrophosphatase LpxH
MCRAAGRHHAGTIEALASLSARVPVTLVPGNHDHPFGGDEGRAALDASGLERVAIARAVVREVADRNVVLEHGHELDADNAKPGGHGETLTRVLHHAIVPMLEHIPLRPNVNADPERLVALRPEERMVPILERWLDEETFERFTEALLGLLVDAGALSRIESWFATPKKLRQRLDDADDLWQEIGKQARGVLEGKEATANGAEDADLLVYGHTHVPDWLVDDVDRRQRLYVNLGSWTQRATDATGPFDETMPVLRISAPATGLRVDLEDAGTGARFSTFDAASRPWGQP